LNVIATASRKESIDYCKQLGADYIIDHTKNIKDELTAIGLDGVDYILNCGEIEPVINQLIDAIKPFGKIVTITGAPKPILVNIAGLQWKRAQLIGEIMYARAIYDVEPERQGQILNRCADLLEKGVLVPRMNKSYDLWTEIQEAHRQQEGGRTIGKVALRVALD